MQLSSQLALVAALAATAQSVWIAGVNYAGCDFGVDTSGNWDGSASSCPTPAQGETDFNHFASKWGFTVFRLPVAWQLLVNNDLTTNELDADFWDNTYGPLITNCLNAGAHCIIDIHNYARWWDEIVGQGGPSSDDLATTWRQIAAKYTDQSNVIFGVMNEPHDLDMSTWASTVQTVVTAIRDATGNTNNIILLPGTDYTGAYAFADDSAPYLESITNPDGTTKNLIYDVHQYFDGSSGGTTTGCSTSNTDVFSSLATYLRDNNRQAMVTELGGGNNANCADLIGQALDVLNDNGDVYIGWTSWAAGPNWGSSYALLEQPNSDGSDQYIIENCFGPKYNKGQ